MTRYEEVAGKLREAMGEILANFAKLWHRYGVRMGCYGEAMGKLRYVWQSYGKPLGSYGKLWGFGNAMGRYRWTTLTPWEDVWMLCGSCGKL